MKFFLLINVVGIFTFMSGKIKILGLSEPEKAEILDCFHTYEHSKLHAQLSCA